jgi:uncharacterized membrane protein
MYSQHLQYFPLSWTAYLVLLGALAILVALIQIGLIRYVYARLGISPMTAMLLLLATLFGGYVNIPVYHIPDETVVVREYVDLLGMEFVRPTEVDWPGTVIAVNLGGAVIPTLLSLYLLAKNGVWVSGLIATAVVSAVCYAIAKPVPGAGIVIPMFIPPLVACAISCIVAFVRAPAVAYASGSLGTLIGADLMNLGNIRGLGTPVASIGGAGTFDGIFVTGIFAVVLASVIGGFGNREPTPSTL